MGSIWLARSRSLAPVLALGLVLALAGAGLLWAEASRAGRGFSELAAAAEVSALQRRQLRLCLEASLGDPRAAGLLREEQARLDGLLDGWPAPGAVTEEADRIRSATEKIREQDGGQAVATYRSELAPLERSLAADEWARTARRDLSASLGRAQALALAVAAAAGLPLLLILAAGGNRPRSTPPPGSGPRDLPGLVESLTRLARDVQHTTQVVSSRAYTDRILRSISNLLLVISPEGRLKAVNGAACDTLGYGEEELLGMPLSAVLEPARDPLLQLSYRNLEGTFLARDGRRIAALLSCSVVREQDGSVRGVVLTAQDISDRKEAEGALRESEERFRAIFSAAALGIARLDLDGRIAHANRALRRLLSLPDEPRLLEEFLQPEEVGVHRELFGALAAGRRDSAQHELRFRDPGGEILWANTIYSLVRDENRRPRFAICMLENVTARKSAEQELDGARQELERYARSLEEKEARLRQLLERLVHAQEEERRTVAHDLHDGLLQYIVAAELHLKAFQMGLPRELHEDLNHGLDRLHSAVVEGRRLIYNLRPATLDQFGLVRTLRRHLEELRAEHGWEVEFQVALADERLPPSVETTVYRLVQEALNNVRKHSGSDWVRVTLRGSPTEVQVEVEDRGVGFDPAAIGAGGVGLHSMRDRAELSGGTFELHSRPREGTRILAVLPLPAGRPAPSEGQG